MIFLAPLQGYTDFIFRNVYSRYYKGIDIAVSPFISLTHGENGISKIAKDVLPVNNQSMQVIPQLLGNNLSHFIQAAKVLQDWGYDSLNWNLGCPVKNITRKKRGSGLLPYPDLIREILENVIPHISQRLSVKIRLGLNKTNEISRVIPVLNDFPLESIIIHPRIGIQMYEGNIYHEVLQNYLTQFKHEIIYNGDIFSFADFQAVKQKYPTIQKWMIGRGVFHNPLLPSIIKGNPLPSVEELNKIFLSFLLDLYNELQIYKQEIQVLNKIKDLWKLFCQRFSDSNTILNKIAHANSLEEITVTTKRIIEEEKMNDWLL
jgi:tRNA-dihydrouridine synthase